MIRPKRWSRRPADRPLRLRAPVLTLFFWVMVLAWDSTGVARWGMLAAILHESGHLLAWVFLVREPPQLELTLWGICLRMRGICLPAWQEKILAAGGPVMNFLVCLGLLGWMDLTGYTYAGCWAAAANLLLGAFNLLPVPGLDGARLLEN